MKPVRVITQPSVLQYIMYVLLAIILFWLMLVVSQKVQEWQLLKNFGWVVVFLASLFAAIIFVLRMHLILSPIQVLDMDSMGINIVSGNSARKKKIQWDNIEELLLIAQKNNLFLIVVYKDSRQKDLRLELCRQWLLVDLDQRRAMRENFNVLFENFSSVLEFQKKLSNDSACLLAQFLKVTPPVWLQCSDLKILKI
jgi:hypothetical protein